MFPFKLHIVVSKNSPSQAKKKKKKIGIEVVIESTI